MSNMQYPHSSANDNFELTDRALEGAECSSPDAPSSDSGSPDPVPSGPYGILLQRIRLAKGISKREAAGQLGLLVTDLRAIEGGRYVANASNVWLRDVLARYGRLLELEPENVLSIFDKEASANAECEAIRLADVEEQNLQQSKSFAIERFAPVAAVVLMACLLTLPFTLPTAQNDAPQSASAVKVERLAQAEQDRAVLPLVSIEPSAGSRREGSSAPDESVEITDVATLFASLDAMDVMDEEARLQGEAAAAPPEPAEAPVILAATAKLPSIDSPTTENGAESPSAVANVNVAEAGSGMKTASASPVVTDLDTLTFSFKEDCWLEVHDANKKRLFGSTSPAGEILKLSGISPFRVLVGRSRQAQLEFNGQPVAIEKIDGSTSTLLDVRRGASDSQPVVTTIRRKSPMLATSE